MADSDITDNIRALRDAIDRLIADARERTVSIQQDGLTLGSGAQQLHTPTASDIPKVHPVWSDDIRTSIQEERRLGLETGPPLAPEVDLQHWPTAITPEVPAEQDGTFLTRNTGQEYDASNPTVLDRLESLHNRADEFEAATREPSAQRSQGQGLEL